MALSKEERIAQGIYNNIGGKGNTNKVYNCMTRVRIDLKNSDNVNVDMLKKIEGVLGVVQDGDNLQVIVGPGTAQKVATQMANMSGQVGVESINENLDGNLVDGRAEGERIAKEVKSQYKKKNDTPFKRALGVIASIFVPLIPAFVGAGIIGGIASIIQNLMTAGTIDPDTWTQIFSVMKILQNGLFAYLNIYIGINAAKVFGATEGLGGVIAGVVYLNGMNADQPLINLFTGDPLSAGQGGVSTLR